MGNRAVIAFGGKASDTPAVYLHWYGGATHVAAFVQAAKALGIREPADDPLYGAARFAQMVGNWIGGTTSVGVGPLSALDTDNGDNGTYVLGEGWAVTERYGDGANNGEADAEKTAAIVAQVLEVNRPIFARNL